MTLKEKERLLIQKRMAISHLSLLQLKEMHKTFVPTEEIPNLKSEYDQIAKLLIEIEFKLKEPVNP
jgi:hypothetical protein